MLAMVSPAILTALFLATREIERAANIYLGAFIFCVAWSMGPQVIGFAGFYNVWPGLTFFPFFTEMFFGPLLYLHADRLMRGGPLGWRKWLLAPGAVQMGYYLWAFVFLGDYQSKWAYNDAVHRPFIIPLESLISLGLFLWASWKIWQMTRRYLVFIAETRSEEGTFNPVWITRMVVLLVPAILLFAFLKIFPVFIQPLSYVDAYPFLLASMLVVTWLGFEALSRLTERFPKMNDAVAAAVPETTDASDRDWAAEAAMLKARLVSEKWYLEPRLSLADLAGHMRTNESYVSRAINRGLGQSFSGLINQLRVGHAKGLLTDKEAGILSVALDSGFNSKATFNRVFREIAGQTPTQYRASIQPDVSSSGTVSQVP